MTYYDFHSCHFLNIRKHELRRVLLVQNVRIREAAVRVRPLSYEGGMRYDVTWRGMKRGNIPASAPEVWFKLHKVDNLPSATFVNKIWPDNVALDWPRYGGE